MYIWNHDEKYIQISTNMPGIGLAIRLKFWEFWENENNFTGFNQWPQAKC